MRGALMKLFTVNQHQQILKDYPSNKAAAAEYSLVAGRQISHQLVRYWRSIFVDNGGNMAKTDRILKEKRHIIKPQPDDDIGNLDFVPEVARRILVVGDLHSPYHHPDSIRFLKTLKEAIGPDLVISIGDEADYHALSFHDSDPNLDSAGMELERAKVVLAELYDLFPQMLVCHSNHGSMQYRRAKAHGIPVQMIKKYRDVLFPNHGADDWSWAFQWAINTPNGKVVFKHQASGPVVADAAHNGCNLVAGHEHGKFGIEYAASSDRLYFGAYCGCLIDKDALAFAYGKHSKNKPIIGAMAILDGVPVAIPMLLDSDGRWTGEAFGGL